MAKKRTSVRKREREMEKRQRELRKSRKAAEKRERKLNRNKEGYTAQLDTTGITVTPDEVGRQASTDSAQPGPMRRDISG